ncbi:hypothetical protein GX48_06299 [Paracoccidioides brasiliensis]|nr:hypothetical protein GX48_06299 [Paracoccidioides brasiliensis]
MKGAPGAQSCHQSPLLPGRIVALISGAIKGPFRGTQRPSEDAEIIEQILSFAEIHPHVNQVEDHLFLPSTELINYCFKHTVLPEAYSPLGSENQVPTTGEKVATDPTLHAIAKEAGYTLAQEMKLTDEQFEAVNKVAEGETCAVCFVDMKDTFGYDVWPEESEGASG